MVLVVLFAIVVGTVVIGSVVAAVLVVVGTVQKKGNWGINFAPPKTCPQCETKVPAVRAPQDFRESMWGGWTCKGCGAKLDKWGKVLRPGLG